MKKFLEVVNVVKVVAEVLLVVTLSVWLMTMVFDSHMYWSLNNRLGFTMYLSMDVALICKLLNKLAAHKDRIVNFVKELKMKKELKREAKKNEIEELNKQIADLKAEIESLKAE